ncbi:MAG: glycosyltransferase family 4 protein, partial [Anaerolineae bacterium]
MRIIYAADARIPSEKAHPYQITQMCEAFAGEGASVTLLYPARANPLHTDDIWGHYGLEQNFSAERLFCIDLMPAADRLPGPLKRIGQWIAARLITLSFTLALIVRLLRERDAVIYARSAILLRSLAAAFPKRTLVYEAHTYPQTGTGLRIRRALMGRVAGVVVITEHLRERYAKLGEARLLVAHDAIRAARFAALTSDQAACRQQLGWPQDAFIAGYMGRLRTLGMGKGTGLLAEAVAALQAEGLPVRMAVVGDAAVADLRAQLPDLLATGLVPAADVPAALRAMSACVMPFPWNEHFAYYASPMKLFEYMASGTPLVASDLPSTAEIITHGENGLLVPPGDVNALAAALRTLITDPP